MSQHEILTEYFEDALENVKPQVLTPNSDFEILEVIPTDSKTDEVISFDESELPEVNDISFEEESFEEDFETLDELEQEVDKLEKAVDSIPGVSGPIQEDEAEDETSTEVTPETDWEKDRDVRKFMNYLRDNYASVPQHSGNSISGCERALKHFNRLNKEISEAVRSDSDDVLGESLEEIEDYRVKILKGMVALKNRINELRKKIQTTKKKADDSLASFMKEALDSEQIVKEATTAKVQMFVTPFERAITGILINAVVSAGNPFEDVFEYLKEKFDLTPREELSILQIVMDMGFPIFKDRGTIADKESDSEEGHGIDFIKNYFA